MVTGNAATQFDENAGCPPLRLLTAFAIALFALLMLAATPTAAFATNVGDTCKCANDDGVILEYEVSKVAAGGEAGAVSLCPFPDADNPTNPADVDIPSSITVDGSDYAVTAIAKDAFRARQYLESVTIPDSVTEMGTGVFYRCLSLSTVQLGSGIAAVESTTFQRCTSLTAISLPDTVTAIESYAFDSCTALKTVALPAKLTSVKARAFNNCGSLTKVGLPNSVRSIGNYAFFNCSSLKSLALPANLRTIGTQAFFGCTGLAGTTLTIPANLTTAHEQSFGNRYFTMVVNNSKTAFDQNCFLDPDDGQTTFFSDTAGIRVTSLEKGVYLLTDHFKKKSSSISLTNQAKVYTGKTLAYSGTVTKSGSSGNVTFAYYGDAACTKAATVKKVGVYYVKATLAADADYEAATSAAAKLTVKPKGTTLKSVKAGVGKFTAKWAKRTAQTSGYQLMYAKNSKFTKGKKTVRITKTKTTRKTVKKLKAKTKYYVKVRTYKKVGKTTLYSSWSKVKKVKTPARKSKKKTTAAAAAALRVQGPMT